MTIRLCATDEVVGCAAMLLPNPDDELPWIGLLLIDADHQRHGLGSEVGSAIDDFLLGAGWKRVRLNVLTAQPDARRFWEQLGYAVIAERADTNNRPVWLLEKNLSAA